MCGRYALRTHPDQIRAFLDLEEIPVLTPRYNIAPAQTVPAVIQLTTTRKLTELRWGLIPAWAKDPKIVHRSLNARSETVTTKPAFQDSFQRRRCLLITDGFYEWERRTRLPYLIERTDKGLFVLAGLWDAWRSPDGEFIQSCTILTTEANDLLRPIHHRMPVILAQERWERWLDPGEAGPSDLLQPAPIDTFQRRPVSDYVNTVGNEGPRCQEARGEQLGLFSRVPCR